MSEPNRTAHHAQHANAACHSPLRPAAFDMIRTESRRWFLQTGVAGVAGLALPDLLRCRAQSARSGRGVSDRKAVILIWSSVGASPIDTWDPKAAARAAVRGTFAAIGTSVPGIRVCEHLPRLARIMDRLTIIRSVDCRSSTDHFPAPMQAGNPFAQRSRIDPHLGTLPSMGAVAARFRGPN